MIKINGNIPKKASAFYLSHGGGPLPLLGDKNHQEMVEALAKVAETIKKPSAIILISAHWEDSVATITHSANPSLIYDYYGFPKAAYEFEYPASGSPEIAERIHSLLKAQNIESRLDAKRGFDHGLYIPLMLMYPEADIPCVQLSLVDTLDPKTHIQMGKAISELLKDDVLIIGSGFSFHNMEVFSGKGTSQTKEMNTAFEQWLINTCSSNDVNEEQRVTSLLNWEQAPSARFCHPREEHLLPLHVCYGAVSRPATAVLQLPIIKQQASMYIW